MKVIRFRKPVPPYNTLEVAGFKDAVADDYVRRKVADFYDPETGEAERPEPVAGEAEVTDSAEGAREEQAALPEGDPETGEAERPDDPEVLPPDYGVVGGQGGYYGLKAPDGALIEGPSNGKHQGKDGAADAAWAHYRGQG